MKELKTKIDELKSLINKTGISEEQTQEILLKISELESTIAPKIVRKHPKIESFVYKITKQINLRVLVHYPPRWKETDSRTAIVLFFGGGWKRGGWDEHLKRADYFAKRGAVAIRADYRVKERHGVSPVECAEDGRHAVEWVRKNAQQLGIDPQKIVVSGTSSGAHVAACTSLKPDFIKTDSIANAMVLFDPVLRLGEWAWDKVPDPVLRKHISPVWYLKKESPPTLLIYGTFDPLISQAHEFIHLSKQLGHRAELFSVKNMGHGFYKGNPIWHKRTLERMDRYLVSINMLESKDKPIVQPQAKKIMLI